MRNQLEIHAIVAGIISVTVALSWNEVAKSAVAAFCADRPTAQFTCTAVYALLTTAIIVIVSLIIRVILRKRNEMHI